MLLGDPRMGAEQGLIDFQDALVGHAAYDLVSLLQDARRDVSPELERAMLDRYAAETGAGADFEADYALLGRSEEHTSELQSLMRISYAVFCLQTNIIIL